ncbi:MAG: hypothetical protein LUE29_09830 [Lachnospiraceae bacterium]|nr:hypothetical protein [Lachnospiraceae bacterium]
MLRITIAPPEQWDELHNEFVYMKPQTLQLEHSLVSLSKWESKWCKPFLSREVKTWDETLDYIKCMTLTQNVDPIIYNYLTNANVNEINKYIDAPMTATKIPEKKNGRRGAREQVTAELIYYWMVTFNIPFECQKWHLNRLLTLVKVCEYKNRPAKKMSGRELASRNSALNKQRRAKLNSRG